MEASNVFTYQYSAKQAGEIEHIRNKYLPAEENKLETLRKMDTRAQSAGMIPALCVGVIGCLIFGVGMCFGLGVFGSVTWPSLIFGGVGTLTMLPAYPLYKRISRKTKEQLAPEILRLSEELMNGQN